MQLADQRDRSLFDYYLFLLFSSLGGLTLGLGGLTFCQPNLFGTENEVVVGGLT